MISSGGVGRYILRSTPSDSYWTHLATLAYKTKLSKSVRAFLPRPCLSFLPHLQLLCTAHFLFQLCLPICISVKVPYLFCFLQVFCSLYWESPPTLENLDKNLSFKILLICHFVCIVFSDTRSRESIHRLCCLGTFVRLLCLSHGPGCFCMTFPVVTQREPIQLFEC